MTFYFFDTKDGGNQLGGPYTSTVEAYAGRFAAEIGPVGEDNVFESANLWLEMWVAKGEDAGSGYQLSPRQKVNSSPLAVRAEKAEMSVSIGRTAPIVTLVSSGMSDPKAL
ncbi:MAG: hypothetical protein HY897_09890 [Deltaproteobacteria bacterium]|nr:hypothetical protein [Deltaproteobacteria bacterium]